VRRASLHKAIPANGDAVQVLRRVVAERLELATVEKIERLQQ